MLEKHYMLVTKNSCSYCHKALELLKKNECSFAYTDMENALTLLDSIKEQTDWKTVPIVWQQTLDWNEGQPVVVENGFVGGYTELLETINKNDTDEKND
jgi:glutaredoxin